MTEKENLDQLSIYTSNICNLQCKYCALKDNLSDKRKYKLSFTDLKNATDYFLKVSKSSTKHILFLGGEPLLISDTILRLVKNYSSVRNLSFELTTNGVLLNQNLIEEFKKYRVNLSVSWDGIKKVNDENRRFIIKKSKSVHNILNNLFQRRDLSKDFCVKMVVTPKNVAFLSKNIEYMAKKGFVEIHLLAELYTKFSKKSLKLLQKELEKISIIVDKYRNVKFRDVEDFLKRLPFYTKKALPWWYECRQLNLGPDGKYYVCDECMRLPLEENEGVVGDLRTGIDFKKRRSLIEEAREYVIKNIKGSQFFFYCPLGLYFLCKYRKEDPYYKLRHLLDISINMVNGLLKVSKIYKRGLNDQS